MGCEVKRKKRGWDLGVCSPFPNTRTASTISNKLRRHVSCPRELPRSYERISTDNLILNNWDLLCMAIGHIAWVVMVTYVSKEAVVLLGPQGVGVLSYELKAVL